MLKIKAKKKTMKRSELRCLLYRFEENQFLCLAVLGRMLSWWREDMLPLYMLHIAYVQALEGVKNTTKRAEPA